MAISDGKKNDTIFLVILVLLVLFAAWLAWKLTSVSPTQPRQTTQTNSASPFLAPTPLRAGTTAIPRPSDFSSLPAVSFTMPAAPTPTPTPTPAATQPSPAPAQTTAQTAPPPPERERAPVVSRPPPKARPAPAPARTAQTQRVYPTHPTRPTNYVPPPDDADVPAPPPPSSTPTPSPRSIPVADGYRPGSPIQGYAIVIAKQQDPASGRYLLACVAEKGSLTYIYEVDAATFNEAAPSLMFSPSKVAAWKFVSSQ